MKKKPGSNSISQAKIKRLLKSHRCWEIDIDAPGEGSVTLITNGRRVKASHGFIEIDGVIIGISFGEHVGFRKIKGQELEFSKSRAEAKHT